MSRQRLMKGWSPEPEKWIIQLECGHEIRAEGEFPSGSYECPYCPKGLDGATDGGKT